MPRAWSQLGVSKPELERAFLPSVPALRQQILDCASRDQVDNAFLAFSAAAEDAVDAALRAQHDANPVLCPARSLPKSFRGRCRNRPLVQKEAASVCRSDWGGGYDPDVEVTSILGRVKVRQVRRIVAFHRSLVKWLQGGVRNPTRCAAQLQAEWCAIRRAKGYPPNFVEWTLGVACFHQFYLDLPPPDWLDDLLSYVRYDCDCVARQEAKRRRENFVCQVSIDSDVGGSRQGFQAMRAAPNPPFTEVPCQVRSKITRSLACPATTDDLRYHVLQEGIFRPDCSASLSGVPCCILAVGPGYVVLHGIDLPSDGDLVQEYVACTAPELHSTFASFWAPLWQRDKGAAATDISEWPQLLDLLQSSGLAGPILSDVLCKPEQWRSAVRKLSSRKATGICGWSPSDIKLLPGEAIDLLCQLFNTALPYGLPDHMLRTRVSVLAKTQEPSHIKQSRPITIFCTLYRVWASIVTRNLLRSWVGLFPPAVSGSVPGKSSRELSYKQQHWIELALISGNCRFGFSLDIIKCFNQLGWPPLRLLMMRLGMPAVLADFWLDGLSRMQGHSCFLSDLSPGIPSCNGAPEGDPISVAALAVVCAFAESLCREPAVAFDTYVDNWSWSSLRSDAIERAVPKALGFLRALRLPVDWTKSYTWATSTRGRQWWRKAHDRVFPDGVVVPAVTAVRDLGVAFKFDGLAHAASRGARLQDGIERLEKLRHQPRSICLKASMIQRGVWPACLYGAEGHCFQLAELQKLRGRAARAVVGQHSVLSPFLALCTLSDVCQGPQVYCLDQQLQLLRRTCATEPDVALSILELASKQRAKSCQGPATALRMAADRLGLSLASTGIVKGRDNSWVDVTACNAREIRLLLQRTWGIHVQEQTSHRNGLGHAPPPSAPETSRLLCKLPPLEQAVLARHITGAFSSAAAKHSWDPEIPAECPLCGLRQTKEHKFLWCSALQHVRDKHKDIIALVRREHPSWVHAPYAAVPPDLEVNRLVFATRSLIYPDVDVPAQALLHNRPFLRLFTDGSCRHPTYPEAAHAGYAVVLDTSLSDASVPSLLATWQRTGQPPNELRVVHQGLVPGVQSINRAEVCAVIQAIRIARRLGATAVEIWTDSAFALTEWDKAGRGVAGTWPDLSSLLQRLFSSEVRLVKIASHQDLNQLEGMGKWLAAGNAAADLAAKAAVLRDLTCVVELADAAQVFLEKQRRHLWSFWQYLLQLSLEENRLLQLSAGRRPDIEQSGPTSAPPLSKWIELNSGHHVAWNVPEAQREWLLACSWPPDFTVVLWEWLRSLQWAVLTRAGRAPAGVAYVELLVHFVIQTGQCPPARLVQPGCAGRCDDPFLTEPVTVRQLTHCLTEAVRQLECLSGIPLWPERRAKVFSLRTLGCKDARIGLSLRPFFSETTQTANLLLQVVQQASVQPLYSFCRNLGCRPSSGSTDLLRVWNSISPSERANRARSLRRCG